MSVLANVTATASSTSLVDSGFFWAELFALTLSALIGVAVTLVIQRYLSAPKIRGGIYGIMRGTGSFLESRTKGKKAFFLPYIYLTNQHRNAVLPLDYEFEIDLGEGYVKLERVYGDYRKMFPRTFEGMIQVKPTDIERQLDIRTLGNHILFTKAKPIRYGDMLRGFVVFTGDHALRNKPIHRAKFTCIDTFQRRHTFKVSHEKFLNPDLFYELVELSP